MKDFYLKRSRLSAALAAVFELFAIWTLGGKLVAIRFPDSARTILDAASLPSFLLFTLVPGVLFFLSGRVCRENVMSAMDAAFAGKLLAAAAYVFSTTDISGARLMPLIFCLSLGAAILELSAFILIFLSLRGEKTERAVALFAVLGTLFGQSVYLFELYAGMKLVGGGVAKWLRLLSLFSTIEMFTSIIRGEAAALLFILIYLSKKQRRDEIKEQITQ